MGNHDYLYGTSPVITTSFVIVGEGLDPVGASRQLGLTGSSREAVGDWPPEVLPAGQGVWVTSRQARESYDTGEEIEALLESIWPRQQQILAFLEGTEYRRIFLSYVEMVDDRPVYELLPESLRRMDRLGASWHLRVVRRSERSQ